MGITSELNRPKVKSPSREELADLVQSLGGETVLISIMERFYQTMSQDLMIGFFFAGHDLKDIAQKQASFFLMAAGMIQHYPGRGPSTAHQALPPILSGHFDRRLVILRQVLELEGLSELQVSAWMRFEESFRAVVVR